MQFLYGRALTDKMKLLCRTKTAAKIAIAYWGKDSLTLLRVNPGRKNVRILCCLKGGKSDPDIIRRFGSRARQHEKLHAKVIWTRRGAIVGSANASSNGLPEEEDSTDGLIEAGIFTHEGSTLRDIGNWFDKQYKLAKHISNRDLEAATLDRNRRLWTHSSTRRRRKRTLIEALQTGGKLEFTEQRIALVLCKHFASSKDKAAVKKFTKAQFAKLEETFKLGRRDIGNLGWYGDWDLPTNTFLIECEIERNHVAQIGVDKTFDIKRTWRVKGIPERITYVLESGFKGFNYTLSRTDKRVIRASVDDLWKRAKGDQSGRIINLVDAAPILLNNFRNGQLKKRVSSG